MKQRVLNTIKIKMILLIVTIIILMIIFFNPQNNPSANPPNDPMDPPSDPPAEPLSEPQGLRWTKADPANGSQPITWRLVPDSGPIDDLDMLEILRSMMENIHQNCAIRFEEVDTDADITIDFVPIDLEGSILGRVFLPTSGENIPVCQCGNVELDESENLSLTDWYNVILHEWAGHALGIFHTEDEVSIMNPFFRSLNFRVQIENDQYLQRELQLRYPS